MAELSDDIRSLIQGGINPVTFEEISAHHRGPRSPRRRTVARVASVIVLVAVAVPVILAVSSAHSTTTHKATGQARHRVISALDTTIASGSFNITFSQQPLTSTTYTTTSTSPCTDGGKQAVSEVGGARISKGQSGSVEGGAASSNGSANSTSVGSADGELCGETFNESPGLAIEGQGTIDTNPFAMVVSTQIPNLGSITLRDNGTDVWELGGGNYGLAPDMNVSGPGSSLPGFAGLVEGTLGARQGALDMMVLANPTGYLELDENAITNANPIGTDTVDGTPVTVYQVTLDPDQEATVSGTNSTESQAIADALAVLKAQGYTGTTVKVAIDAAGYIRQTVSTAMFSDGASQTGETTFSNFGCAGTVLMPGQSGPATPPSGCVSPDTTTTTSPTPTTTAPLGGSSATSTLPAITTPPAGSATTSTIPTTTLPPGDTPTTVTTPTTLPRG
jgi:hypothetical protein